MRQLASLAVVLITTCTVALTHDAATTLIVRGLLFVAMVLLAYVLWQDRRTTRGIDASVSEAVGRRHRGLGGDG